MNSTSLILLAIGLAGHYNSNGSGSGAWATFAVPDPTAVVLLMLAVTGRCRWRDRKA